MKSLVLCVCVLIIGFQSSYSIHPREQSRNELLTMENDVTTCMAENRLTDKDFYDIKDIIANVHTKSENEERTKNIGCFIACVLKKQNLMKGSHIKEEEILAKLNMFVDDDSGRMNTIVRKCMVEARSNTHECEKCLSIYTCVARGIHEVQEREEHEEK